MNERKRKMNKPKYTSDVTKFATVKMATERYKLSKASVIIMAKQCHALIHIGRSVRIDIEKLDKALDELSERGEA